MADLLKCKFCSNDETDNYPPIFVVYNTKAREVVYVLCAQCMYNIELIAKDDDIPF